MEYSREMTLWLTDPEDFVLGRPAKFWLDGNNANMESQGWLRISEHTIRVEFPMPSQDDIRGMSIEALRGAIRKIDAEAQKAKNHLEGRIQNLLAIGHDAPEPRPAEDGFDDDVPF